MNRASKLNLGYPWLLKAFHFHVNITLLCSFFVVLLLLKSISTTLRLVPSDTTQIDPINLPSSSSLLSNDITHSFDDHVQEHGDDYDNFHGRFPPSLLEQSGNEKIKSNNEHNYQMIGSNKEQTEGAFLDKPNVQLPSQDRGAGRTSATTTTASYVNHKLVSKQMPVALSTESVKRAEEDFLIAEDDDPHKQSPEQTTTSPPMLISLGRDSSVHPQDNETQVESDMIMSDVSESGNDKEASSAGRNMENLESSTQIASDTIIPSLVKTASDGNISSSEKNSMSVTVYPVRRVRKEDSTTQMAHDIIIPSEAKTGSEKQDAEQLIPDIFISLFQKDSQPVHRGNDASSTDNEKPIKRIEASESGNEKQVSAITIIPVPEASNENQVSQTTMISAITITPVVAKDGNETQVSPTKMASAIIIPPVAEAGNEKDDSSTNMASNITIPAVAGAGNKDEEDSTTQLASDITTPSVLKASDGNMVSTTQMISHTIISDVTKVGDDKELSSQTETDPETFSSENNSTDADTHSTSIDPLSSAYPPSKPYALGLKITDWDEQRHTWLYKNYPDFNTPKPRVLLITGSPSKPCDNPEGAHYLLKCIKNKIDYCRLHGIQVFYNMVIHNEDMSGFWLKLPLIRQLMLAHPEVEWLWWMDSDAMFTDMSFEIPFEKYKEYNMVVPGYEEQVYIERSWCGLNAGSFLMRNSQWSLDMLDAWAQMGPKGKVREDAGKLLGQFLSNRGDYEADDQSALVYLLVTQRDIWGKKVYLEKSYCLHGFWLSLVDKFQDSTPMVMPSYDLGSAESYRELDWPFVTHFVGCKPCGGDGSYPNDQCMLHMERSFNFADNQILRTYGFQHQTLNSSHVIHSYVTF